MFNAAYAKEFGLDESERERFGQFIVLLLTVDDEKQIHDVLLKQFPGPIRTLLDNKFVFEPFWKALREHDSSNRWEEKFAASKRAATGAILRVETAIVLDRLYVLRNQLIHGGATWNSRVNRTQLKDGITIMSA